MPGNRDDLLRMLIPPVVAVALVLLFFAIFDRWTKINDPINSVAALLLGMLGFAAGAALDWRRAGGRRPAGDAAADVPPAAE